MKIIRWNNEKNEWLIRNRGVCFEQAVLIFENDEIMDVVEHPNRKKYPVQKMAIVDINDCASLVPYVEDEEEIFLKTMIPSRKATDIYLRGGR
ncbi:MAG: BrnT family toxin [Pirellulales bacterium]|nr:BrnT family toxin [Pirellulales bacterium]